MDAAKTPQRLATTLTVYLSAFLQGLTLVSFPASSTALRSLHHLTDAQYGAIFLPQVALAVIGAVGGGILAKRLGLKTLLWLALLANALSQAALAASVAVAPHLAYVVILTGTACLGLGFGVSGAPLNSLPPLIFPAHRNSAVVAVHTALGVGLMCGPLYAAGLMRVGLDLWFPLSLFVACLLLAAIVMAVRLSSGEPARGAPATGTRASPPLASRSFWLFVAIAMLYAFAEGTFANWATVYLQETKQLPEEIAALALSVFWAAMVAGRLLTSVAVLRVAAEWVWFVFPPLMVLAFWLLPYADSAFLGIGFFALAGIACSAFFPLTVAIVSKHFKDHVAWVSSMMIAALMVGVGLGSYIVGPLQQWLALERLYQLSSIYPILAFVLMLVLLRAWPQTVRRR